MGLPRIEAGDYILLCALAVQIQGDKPLQTTSDVRHVVAIKRSDDLARVRQEETELHELDALTQWSQAAFLLVQIKPLLDLEICPDLFPCVECHDVAFMEHGVIIGIADVMPDVQLFLDVVIQIRQIGYCQKLRQL
jgi:hypothetical protein